MFKRVIFLQQKPTLQRGFLAVVCKKYGKL